jgi:hypothetical protein
LEKKKNIMSPRALLLSLLFVASARGAVGQNASPALEPDRSTPAAQTVSVANKDKPVSAFVEGRPELAVYDSIVRARGATATLTGIAERPGDYPLYRFETLKTDALGKQLRTTEIIATDSSSVIYDEVEATYGDMKIKLISDVDRNGYSGQASLAFTNIAQQETGDLRLYSFEKAESFVNTLSSDPSGLCKQLKGVAHHDAIDNPLDVTNFVRGVNGGGMFIDRGTSHTSYNSPGNR